MNLNTETELEYKHLLVALYQLARIPNVEIGKLCPYCGGTLARINTELLIKFGGAQNHSMEFSRDLMLRCTDFMELIEKLFAKSHPQVWVKIGYNKTVTLISKKTNNKMKHYINRNF